MTNTAQNPVNVMLVDDSNIIRGVLRRALGKDKDIKVLKSVSDGQQALDALSEKGGDKIDVIILDIEMPVMDGMTALPKLLEIAPHVQVIISSTLTEKNAEVTLKAFKMGATECLCKPSSMDGPESQETFYQDLLLKVKTLAKIANGKRNALNSKSSGALPSAIAGNAHLTLLKKQPITAPDVLAIGSSTGGPHALLEFFKLLGKTRCPVFITQHMPATFTHILAQSITEKCDVDCAEAKDGEPVLPGRVYIAPGDYHMVITPDKKISLNQDPPENYCRPSVDPMMRSLSDVYGRKILSVILTGMGKDGLEGCRYVVKNGGVLYAQDEKSSVVWGMPGAVAQAGLCSEVLTLLELPSAVKKHCR